MSSSPQRAVEVTRQQSKVVNSQEPTFKISRVESVELGSLDELRGYRQKLSSLRDNLRANIESQRSSLASVESELTQVDAHIRAEEAKNP